jgi:GNAT superfamily N-acetyltransferase
MAAKRKPASKPPGKKLLKKPPARRAPHNIKLIQTTTADTIEIATLRTATSENLIAKFGVGSWSSKVSDKGVLFGMRRGTVFKAVIRGRIVATLTLSAKKPWAIDTKYFARSQRPYYLTAMVVALPWQRQAIGRRCLTAVIKICQKLGVDALRLDAYDAPAGAGEFYRKCGFTEVGRVTYRNAPLIYYQLLL